jgi:hypothetical protein
MRREILLLFLAACMPAAPPASPEAAALPDAEAAARELSALQARHREGALATRRFTHRQLWESLGRRVDRAPGIAREEVGRSAEGRPLYAVRHGQGPVRVLLWSQMHGNEPTATLVLADLFRFLAEAPEHPRARRLAERLTLVALPMLNPDGAERFQRRNAQGIDVNRDARALSTPEARALREVHRRFRPHFGFNLHDQDVRTRVGSSDRLAALALLAPPRDRAGTDDAGRMRAKRVAAVVRRAVDPLVEGHVARYDDTFNPRAFGDRMQSWGTSTVLIESGGWRDDPEKQHLRTVTFVALLSALDAIATGAYESADPGWYEGLPGNGARVNDLLVRGGTVVLPGMDPYRADLAVDYADPLSREGGRIVEVGDLAGAAARDTLDAAGLFVHSAPGAAPAPGAPAAFTLRRGREATSEAVWVVEEGAPRRFP